MNMSGITVRRGVSGIVAGCVLGGIAAGIAAPTASAEPCTADGATSTISSVSGATSQYLANHPGANQVLTNAASQAPADARNSVRAYFTANPSEYFALKGITAPLVDLQNRCGTASVPADWVAAFNEFQAG
jgi:hemophore-related protein